MEPTYRDGDAVMVNHTQLLFRDPIRNEIVVIKLKDGDTVIKRVVALPGDVVGEKLGPDEYWVVGDNLAVSDDSRSFGPVKRTQILGIVE